MQGLADLAAEAMSPVLGDDFEHPRARYLETSGIPFAQQLEIIHTRHPLNGAVAAEFEPRKVTVARAARMEPSTVSGLHALKQRDLRLFVSSSTSQSLADDFVARERFPFDGAFGFDASRGMAKGRPHGELVQLLFRLQPPDILFCGDSLKERELAGANRLRFVGKLGTSSTASFERAHPDAPTISKIEELAEVF